MNQGINATHDELYTYSMRVQLVQAPALALSTVVILMLRLNGFYVGRPVEVIDSDKVKHVEHSWHAWVADGTQISLIV